MGEFKLEINDLATFIKFVEIIRNEGFEQLSKATKELDKDTDILIKAEENQPK